MAGPVKPRRYDSQVRTQRARENRDRVLLGARDLFLERGFARTSMAAVAQRAGVSEALVFTQFGSKAQLLGAVIATAAADDTAEIPLLVRPQFHDPLADADPRRALRALAATATGALGRTWRLMAVAREAAETEPAMRQVLDQGASGRHEDARRIVQALGRLSRGIDENQATDVLWAFLDTRLYELLAVSRQWGKDRFADWLAETLLTLLIENEPPPTLTPDQAHR
jgi:AcrR family transcriptional regulator